ncbi:MAG: glycosyl hydrolase [Cytophagaceae bacterium]
MKQIILAFGLLFLLKNTAMGQQVFPGGGTGSYNLTIPLDDYQGVNTFDVIGGGAAGAGYITRGPNYTGPFQSHQWWTSALWNVNLGNGTDGEVTFRGHNHSGRMFPYPMILTAANTGFEISYRPNANIVSGANQVNNGPVLIHMRVGFTGQNATATSVDGYGDWHATFRQVSGANILRATTASGCPYLFVERNNTTDLQFYNQGTSRLNAIYTDANVHAVSITADPMNSAASQATIGLFFPPGTTLGGYNVPGLAGNVNGMAPFGANFTADIPDAARYVTVAVLPDASQATLTLFAQRAFNFITGTTHTYNFNETAATLTTNFNVTTTNVYGAANTGTLQALYRHQWLYSPQANGAEYTGLQYYCPRGAMRLVRGNTFSTVMPHLGILPNLAWANTANRVQLNNYINAFANSLALMANAADGYNKDQFMELTTNLQIARQIGNMAAFNTILFHLRDRLQDWLVSNDANYNRYFAYSPLFNHMSHYPNGFGSSGTFVDAHFHVGYFIMAAAILARYDAAFINNYGAMVETVIRSIANETKEMTDPGNNGNTRPWFPYLKYFDPYTGHSWADAMATDQESVSEAINFAAGVFLWGQATNNNTMKQLGALLFVTESEAARQYWFDVDGAVNGAPYANAYTHRHMTMVYNWGGNYATFFGNEPEWIHGITYVPVTGASTWLGTHVQGAATEYAQIGQNYGQWGGWGEAINAQHATHNATAAIAAFNANNGLWGITKRAFTYHWIHTFDSVGVIDATVRADIAGYQVFKKGDCKHYMIYMPRGQGPRVVTFTDGRSFNVPNDTVIVYKVCPNTLPVELLEFEAKKVKDKTVLKWSTAFEKDNSHFIVQRSRDVNNWESIGTVESKGNSNSLQEYTMVDESPLSGINYYRLIQVDLDHTESISKIVSINFNSAQGTLMVYPNPADNFVIVQLMNYEAENSGYIISLKDMLGREVHAETIREISAEGKHISLDMISKGVYFIEVRNIGDGEVQTVRLVRE